MIVINVLRICASSWSIAKVKKNVSLCVAVRFGGFSVRGAEENCH
jgi:hypothetical protein